MNSLPDFCLYTSDDDLDRRVQAYAAHIGQVRVVRTPEALLHALTPEATGVLLLDMRAPRAVELLLTTRKQHPDMLVIALGELRSDPMLQAEHEGAYAVVAPKMERKSFQNVLARALEHHGLRQENKRLKAELAQTPTVSHVAQAMDLMQRPRALDNLKHFVRACQHANNNGWHADLLAGVADAAGVGRAGMFLLDDTAGEYHFYAGIKCLAGTEDLSFHPDAALVSVLENASSVVSAKSMGHCPSEELRRVVQQTLDVFGAEAIVPLHLDGQLLGWIFLGQCITGAPLAVQDLHNLMTSAEFVASLIGNSRQQEETRVQRGLLMAIIDSLSVGLVAVSRDARVRCINTMALQTLRRRPRDVLHQPLDCLDELGDLLEKAMRGGDESALGVVGKWQPPKTGMELDVHAWALERDGDCVGAFALVKAPGQPLPLHVGAGEFDADATDDEACAAITPHLRHTIKNQLVAINTLVQLLPERYEDPEFREQFCQLTADEVGRITELLGNDTEAPAHH